MSAVPTVISVLLAVALTGSAIGTLARNEHIVEEITKVGIPDSWLPRLAILKLAGASGLLLGLAVPQIGAAAALGIVLYFIGAVVIHLRAGDFAFAPAAVLGLVALTTLVFRVMSLLGGA